MTLRVDYAGEWRAADGGVHLLVWRGMRAIAAIPQGDAWLVHSFVNTGEGPISCDTLEAAQTLGHGLLARWHQARLANQRARRMLMQDPVRDYAVTSFVSNYQAAADELDRLGAAGFRLHTVTSATVGDGDVRTTMVMERITWPKEDGPCYTDDEPQQAEAAPGDAAAQQGAP